MKRQSIVYLVIASAALLAGGIAFAATDRFALNSPNGIAFSEFKVDEKGQVIGSAMSDDASGCGTAPAPGCIKSIVGNAAAIRMYAEGAPANGKPVPDGAVFVKIEWLKHHEVPVYGVTVPGKLAEVAFMVKDSKRFPDTNGWGYATMVYDETSDTWKAKGDGPAFGKAECHACHTIVKARDYLFTSYPKR
jgi:Cytochrome P460